MRIAASAAPTKGKIIVFGILFWYPLAGVTYQFLHYLLGLRRLGYDPYYVEDSARWVYDPEINDFNSDPSGNIARVVPVLEAYGFSGHWAFRSHGARDACYGISEGELDQLYRDADAFLNVTGAQELRDEHVAIPRRIYVETDPVASQIKVAQGDEKVIAALADHPMHFTFGENLGAPDCGVPVERFRWQPTRQPIALDLWDNELSPGPVYTTVATWRNKGNDLVYGDETYYWSKHREFLKILDLPHRSAVPLELAMSITGTERQLLEEHGWRIRDAARVSGDMDRYGCYIRGSRGEFTVAKDQNIRLRSGWFSDRSACYLAAGRPVVTQETGFSNILPTGRGLFAFKTIDDVLEAFESIENNYPAHCRAARDIAAEYFAADRVLGSLLTRAGL